MSEPKTVFTETWPVAADEEGLWLLSGDGPLTPALPVMADDSIHADVELELHLNAIDLSDVVLLHGTSCRDSGPSAIQTHIVIVRRPGAIRMNWPSARPISTKLPGAVGKPLPHDAAEPPVEIREIDILLHALRHVAFLRDFDSTSAAALDEHWLRHIKGLKPALFRMYHSDEDRAADRLQAA